MDVDVEHLPLSPELGERVLRLAATRERALDWSLVLTSEGIPHQVRRAPALFEPPPNSDAQHLSGEWAVITLQSEVERAQTALRDFDAENVPRAPGEDERVYPGASAAVAFALVCIAGPLLTGPRDETVLAFARGSADAARILAGEWFRVLTALTLHEDYAHAFGNAVSGAFLAQALSRRVGPAVTALLLVAAGAAGNAVTAELMRAHFVSIGASTAVFAALGALVSLQLVRRVRRGWMPIGAGLALLGMMGAGERSDLSAHLFGFVAGFVFGFAAALLRRPPRPSWLQGALALVALSPLAAAWWLALR